MRSKISLCNKAILRKNLTRFWPLWVLYFIVWSLALPLNIYTSSHYLAMDPGNLQNTVYNVAQMGGGIITFIYAIAAAMCLFSPFYGARSVNTIAALPVRRETNFLTHVFTGLLMALVPNLLVMLLTMLSGAAIGMSCVALSLEWFLIVAMEYVFFFGLACLCACMVGSLLFLPVLYGILSFAATVLNMIVMDILSGFVYGLSSNYSGYVLTPLSPVVELLSNSATVYHEVSETVYYYTFSNWPYLGILAGVGAVLLAVSFLLFRKRHMESAGDVIAIRPLRPIFKYCFTVGCCLVLGMIIVALAYGGISSTINVVGLTLSLLLGAFLGYFGAEMLLKKTFRVWRHGWLGFGAFSVCLIAAVCAMEFDATGFERRVPAQEEVKSVVLGQYYGARPGVVITDEAYIQDLLMLHQRVVSEKAQAEDLLDEVGTNPTVGIASLDLSYTLRDGSAINRSYSIPYTDILRLDRSSLIGQYTAIYNDPVVEELRYTPTDGLTAEDITYGNVDGYFAQREAWESFILTTEQAKTLYRDCILPDIRDGKLHTQLAQSTTTQVLDDSSTTFTISISFERSLPATVNGRLQISDYLTIDVTGEAEAPRTTAFLESLGLEMQSAKG